jgi:hypothetical protein
VVEVSFTRHTTIPRDQGRRANSALACADCELFSPRALDLGLCPRPTPTEAKSGCRAVCKPRVVEPSYLQTNPQQGTKTPRHQDTSKALRLSELTFQMVLPLSSRLRETHDPIGGETFSPRHDTNTSIVRLPQPKGKKLSASQRARSGQAVPDPTLLRTAEDCWGLLRCGVPYFTRMHSSPLHSTRGPRSKSVMAQLALSPSRQQIASSLGPSIFNPVNH